MALLDPMIVLSASKGKDDSGALILADKKWLEDSVFQTIWLHKDFKPYIYPTAEESGVYIAGVDYFGDIEGIDLDDTDSFVNDGPERPFNHYAMDDLQRSILYLIDMATDELAKKGMRIINSSGKTLKKSQRKKMFRNTIADQIRDFILNELPQTLVELLGYQLDRVLSLFQIWLLTIYQSVYLLAEYKAGVGDGVFLYYYKEKDGWPVVPYTGWDALFFLFPFEMIFCPGFFYKWIKRDEEDTPIIIDTGVDLFFPRECVKLYPPESNPFYFDQEWQFLSFNKEKGINKAELLQKVMQDGANSLYHELKFAEKELAENIEKSGLVSPLWKGVYRPTIKRRL